MNEGLIPRRYAKALYGFALEKGADLRVYELMKTLSESIAAAPGVHTALANPYVADADKVKLLSTAAEAKASDAVYADFISLLAQNSRLDMAREVAQAYIDLYREKNRIYDVRVESAAPMSATEEKRLRQFVGRHLQGGSMEYSHSVNPDLIGGFTLSVGNQRIDASVSNELKQLRLNLLRK